MSEYISWNQLAEKWDLRDAELLEYLKEGLQPLSDYDFQPLSCPYEFHEYSYLFDHQLTNINSILAAIRHFLAFEKQLTTSTEKQFSTDDYDFRAFDIVQENCNIFHNHEGVGTLVISQVQIDSLKKCKSTFRRKFSELMIEMEQIVDEDPEIQSWQYLKIPARSDDIKKVIAFLKTKDAVFQTSTVLEVEEEFEILEDLGRDYTEAPTLEGDQLSKSDKTVDNVNYFRFRGDFWDIGYKGKTASIKDLPRHKHVIHLLEKPHLPLKAKQLSRLVGGIEIQTDDNYNNMTEDQLLEEEGLSLEEMEVDGLEKEDKEKMEEIAYQTFYAIKDAEKKGDEEQIKSAKDAFERMKELFLSEYKIFVFSKGNDVKFSFKPELKDDSNKARVNVRKHIKSSIEDIKKHIPDLGEYLEKYINTGNTCILESLKFSMNH
ncbi:MAG: hypothetical protein JRE12_01045 [Deltaproteobacteria bacterium]|nr:hypothetical protein [Deltaproteobacteria bacterium]